MKITEPPRSPERRKRDLLSRLATEMDIWVATADADGLPCLVPLWFSWDGEALWLATRPTTPTGRNLRDGGRARLALGDTLDVVLIDGDVQMYAAEEAPSAAAEVFLAKTGWDPRTDGKPYVWFQVRPRAIQARNGEHEMPGRHLMRDGVWVV
ncbi:pyridoxamine 5'-phosphate oxidase [Streptomyces cyaneochromogenes]|uniref:Pyridoxamine 5'-phosphate oxidase n=1 Tax=Streptomyces cyaneochromogenes TaxID=2496836 RepID=A0A3Q9EZC4_9ACTN|nr:pyridoxamine 5'-phosphate oxidase family protein [Streptomyces cyaneochromogenes]AZQ39596.1 pyridoxamine 5'-phosphate oxidase [Streptomyces cyaneochromogenes]